MRLSHVIWISGNLLLLLMSVPPSGRAEQMSAGENRPELVIQQPPGVIWSVTFTPDSRFLLAFGDGGARLYELETGRELRRLHGDGNPFIRGAFSPDGRLLAVQLLGQETSKQLSIDQLRTVPLVDFLTGKQLGTLKDTYPVTVMVLTFSPDGRRLATYVDKSITLWDVAAESPPPSGRP